MCSIWLGWQMQMKAYCLCCYKSWHLCGGRGREEQLVGEGQGLRSCLETRRHWGWEGISIRKTRAKGVRSRRTGQDWISNSLNLGPKSHLTRQVGAKKVSLGKGQVDPHWWVRFSILPSFRFAGCLREQKDRDNHLSTSGASAWRSVRRWNGVTLYNSPL